MSFAFTLWLCDFLVGLCPLASFMSRERRDLSKALFHTGVLILFLLCGYTTFSVPCPQKNKGT